jgi:hypothetical protein
VCLQRARRGSGREQGRAGGSGKQAKQGRDQGRASDVVRGSRWWMVDGARATGGGRTGGSRVVVVVFTSRESRIDQWPLLRRWRQSERWKGGRAAGSRRGRGRDAICAWVVDWWCTTTALKEDAFDWTGLAVSTAAWRPELLTGMEVSLSPSVAVSDTLLAREDSGLLVLPR